MVRIGSALAQYDPQLYPLTSYQPWPSQPTPHPPHFGYRSTPQHRRLIPYRSNCRGGWAGNGQIMDQETFRPQPLLHKPDPTPSPLPHPFIQHLHHGEGHMLHHITWNRCGLWYFKGLTVGKSPGVEPPTPSQTSSHSYPTPMLALPLLNETIHPLEYWIIPPFIDPQPQTHSPFPPPHPHPPTLSNSTHNLYHNNIHPLYQFKLPNNHNLVIT